MPGKSSAGRLAALTIGTFVVASVAWVCLGFLATAPLGAIYGWSGHPSIPAAPESVYVGLYLVVLPAICLFGASSVVRWIAGRRPPT